MKWIKASDRLPKKAGRENKVIVRWKGIVTYGFKNYDENIPEMYIEYCDKSYLTNDVEWLDEYSISDEIINFVFNILCIKRSDKNIITRFNVSDKVLILINNDVKSMKIIKIDIKGWKNKKIYYLFKNSNNEIIYRQENKCYKDFEELKEYVYDKIIDDVKSSKTNL